MQVAVFLFSLREKGTTGKDLHVVSRLRRDTSIFFNEA